MKMKIGFADKCEEKYETEAVAEQGQIVPRRSVVQVFFPGENKTYAYYNDSFDLKYGDLVYVDGKLAGKRGMVRDVSYCFKIKLSDYKRVIAVADTAVHGEFFMAGSHFVTFDANALPAARAITWFRAPDEREEEYAVGSDDGVFYLDRLPGMKVLQSVAEQGQKYYGENKVRYLSVDGDKGYAIVEGSAPYEVEFTYHNGVIGNLTCSCFCTDRCKHGFAAMLQLKEVLEHIEQHYAAQFEKSEYFAAVHKGTLFELAVEPMEAGSLIL